MNLIILALSNVVSHWLSDSAVVFLKVWGWTPKSFLAHWPFNYGMLGYGSLGGRRVICKIRSEQTLKDILERTFLIGEQGGQVEK